MGKSPFNIIEVVVAIVLLGVLAASIIYAIDPAERANKERDQTLAENSKAILEAINKFWVTKSVLPWNSDPTSHLSWRSSQDPSLGLCSDSSCASGGSLAADGLLTSALLGDFFIKSRDPKEWIYIGKGEGAGSLIHACFIPQSKYLRVDYIPLRELRLGEMPPAGDIPDFCPAKPDWTTSVCYSCVSQKLSPTR